MLALLAWAASGFALWRTFDAEGKQASTPTTTVPPGPPLVEVPSEVSKNGMTAMAELTNLKFVVTVTSGPSVTTRRNYVINQDPAAGTLLPEGSAVQIQLSSGSF